MGLPIGSDYIIASRNTYWVIINLVLGTIVVFYFILYLLGLIDFLGDVLIPGLAWKIPTMLGIFIGNVFSVSMSSVLILPVLALQILALLTGVLEAFSLGSSVIGCLAGTPTLPCDTLDQIALIFLGVLMIIYVLGLANALISIIEYMRGFNRYMLYVESERGLIELEDQEFLEQGL